MRIVLASKSPRRQELMRLICCDFISCVSDADELIPPFSQPFQAVELIAEQKAKAVFSKYPNDIVIGADTIVVLGTEIIGKPADETDAEKTLLNLSGKTHSVYTGVCLMTKRHKRVFHKQTEVKFYPLEADEIKRYVKTKEPMDKAGAYGIQGAGALFVESINGDYYNVMGLPVALLNKEIKKLKEKINETDNPNPML